MGLLLSVLWVFFVHDLAGLRCKSHSHQIKIYIIYALDNTEPGNTSWILFHEVFRACSIGCYMLYTEEWNPRRLKWLFSPQQSKFAERGSKSLPTIWNADWNALNKPLRIAENASDRSWVIAGQVTNWQLSCSVFDKLLRTASNGSGRSWLNVSKLTNSHLRHPTWSFLVLFLNFSNEFPVREWSLPSFGFSSLFAAHSYHLILYGLRDVGTQLLNRLGIRHFRIFWIGNHS